MCLYNLLFRIQHPQKRGGGSSTACLKPKISIFDHPLTTLPSPQPYVAPLDGSCPTAPQVLIASMDTDTTHQSPEPYVASLDGSCPTALAVLIASMDTDTTHRSPQAYVAPLDGSCPAAPQVLVASLDVDTPGRGPVPGAGPQPRVDSLDGTLDNGPRVLIASMDVDSPQVNPRVLIASMDSAATPSTLSMGTPHPPRDCPERFDVPPPVYFVPYQPAVQQGHP